MPELDGDRRTWTGKRGSIDFVRLPPLVAVLIFKGRVTDDAASVWHEYFPWVLADEGAHLFLDGGELDYAGARTSATGVSMVSKARKRIAAAHVLVRGGLIEAIADAANVSFGGFMQLHRERKEFEDELDRALRSQG